MKKNIFGSLFLAATMAVGFSACQSEDIPAVNDSEEVKTVHVVANVNVNTESRTDKTPTDNGLEFAWSEKDQIVVLSNDGRRPLGVLTLISGAGEADGSFEGNLSLRNSDEKVSVAYLGKAFDGNLANVKNNHVFNIANQRGASTTITDFDILYGKADVNRSGANATIEFTITSHLALAHYYFHLPEGVAGSNEEVTIAGANVASEFTFNFADGSFTNVVNNSSILVNTDWTKGASNEGEAWMVLLPGAIKPDFTVTVGEKEYNATIEEGNYRAAYVYSGGSAHGKDVYFTENGEWTLNYSAEGATNVPEAQIVKGEFGPSYTFTVSTQVPVKEDYKFLGWSTEENGQVNVGKEITLTQPGVTKTIYAVWEEAWKSQHYILYYGKNGNIAQQDQYLNDFCKIPWIFDSSEIESPVKEGYEFIGWADTEGETVAKYALGSTIDITKYVTTKTVYPVWKKKSSEAGVTAPGAGGVGY